MTEPIWRPSSIWPRRAFRQLPLAFRDRGIMVTRHSAWDFTVELHPDVPYGQTHETQLW